MEENLPQPGRHRALEEAQELLMARRAALRLAREGSDESRSSCDPTDAPHPGKRETEDREKPTASSLWLVEAVAGLPEHLGWGSAAQTAVLRAAARRHNRKCQPGREDVLKTLYNMPPASLPPAPAAAQPTFSAAGAVSLAPALGLAILRQKQAAGSRLWLLLRSIDTKGRGSISLNVARMAFTDPQSPLRFCGQRQLRNLLAAGSGLFWEVDDTQIWLRSAVRVAHAVGVAHFGGQDVALPIAALIGGISKVRANLFASFHSGRGAKPIARQTMATKSGVAPRTQRHYDRICGVGKQANYARGPRLGSPEAEEQAWQHGPASFAWRDKRKRPEGQNGRFLAWQLPNSYHGPHDRLGRGRQKRQNKALADLLNKGTAGNGRGQNDDLSARYFADARAASRAYGRNSSAVYWPAVTPGIWHCLWLPTADRIPPKQASGVPGQRK